MSKSILSHFLVVMLSTHLKNLLHLKIMYSLDFFHFPRIPEFACLLQGNQL